MLYERELRLKKIDVLLFIRKQLFEQVLGDAVIDRSRRHSEGNRRSSLCQMRMAADLIAA